MVGVAGERLAREAVVAGGGEQPQRVPALAPRGRGRVGGVEDREVAALLGEVVADGEAGLAAADDDDVAVGAHGIWTSVIGGGGGSRGDEVRKLGERVAGGAGVDEPPDLVAAGEAGGDGGAVPERARPRP